MDASSQDTDNSTRNTSGQDDPHSDFLGSESLPSSVLLDLLSLQLEDSHAFDQISPQQGTGSTLAGSSCSSYISPPTERTSHARNVSTDSQASEILLTANQAPDSPFEMDFNNNDANTDNAAQTYDPFLNDPPPDPRPQYEQPNVLPSPHHVRRDPVPYDQPGPSSTTVSGPGLSLHAGFNELFEVVWLEGSNTVTAPSSGQMLGAEPSLSVDQVPKSPFGMGFNYNDANTNEAAQTYGPFLNDPLPDSRPHHEQPNFLPPPHDVLRDPVPYDQPRSSSTIVSGPGHLFHGRFNEPPGFEGFDTGTASSSDHMLGAGPSLSAAQEQSPTTLEASPTREERGRAKKKRDRLRKRNERWIDSQGYERICEVLNIPLSPKNTLANRILQAVEKLVEQRNLYADYQRRANEAESNFNILRKRFAQLGLM